MVLHNILENRKILTVSEITKKLKNLLIENFSDIWVRGEVSNCKTAASGHIYFTLKDESAVLKAVLFRGYQKDIRFSLEDGIKVIVHGNLDIFDRRGEYQIIADFIEPEGIGALQLAFEQLKEKLSKEGLFDQTHKLPVPPFPDTIGIITSPSGAAIKDILNVIGRRYQGIRIIIYPTLVQGEGASAEIVQAIQKANLRKEVDVLILTRGGGSLEDLWPFNEEIVARAIYNSSIPIISAVGHEIDYTISDFVADLRAPTPSAAAELVVQNKKELLFKLKDLLNRLNRSITNFLERKKEKIAYYSPEELLKRLENIMIQKNFLLDDSTRSLFNAMDLIFNASSSTFKTLVGRLEALSPLATLSRGFAFVSRIPEKKPLSSILEVQKGDDIKTRLKDGTFYSKVTDIDTDHHQKGDNTGWKHQ